MTREEIQDFTLRITHANKTEMIVVLYDIILTYINEAQRNLEKDDMKAFRESIKNLKNSFRELVDSVDTSMELGLNLLQLYVFCQGQVTRSLTSLDAKYLDTVKKIISDLRDSYEQVAAQDKSGSVMENTEKVYSGLTYNPYGRSENMVDTASNRGFLA